MHPDERDVGRTPVFLGSVVEVPHRGRRHAIVAAKVSNPGHRDRLLLLAVHAVVDRRFRRVFDRHRRLGRLCTGSPPRMRSEPTSNRAGVMDHLGLKLVTEVRVVVSWHDHDLTGIQRRAGEDRRRRHHVGVGAHVACCRSASREEPRSGTRTNRLRPRGRGCRSCHQIRCVMRPDG